MKRLLPLLGLLAACASAPDPMRVDTVTAPPTLHIGLGRCLRDERVRLRTGPDAAWMELHAGHPALAKAPATFRGDLEVEYTRDHRNHPVKPTVVRYHGVIHVHVTPDRKLILVNEVEIEAYLKGVVGKEMSLSEGAAALQAQVIAARTYALQEQRLGRLRAKGEPFDLYDDERSQVYGGLERETDLARRIVDETRGRFVVYGGRLVRTFYASTCGGHTEPGWLVLPDESEETPPLAGRRCDYCVRRPTYRWKEPAVISKKEIAERCAGGAPVRSVEVTRTLPGGHALELKLHLEDGRALALHANNEFRRKLVTHRLRSTLWEKIEDRGDAIAIHGRGFGHGVGMCQVGAYEMAKDGKSATEILEYYYPGAAVRRLY